MEDDLMDLAGAFDDNPDDTIAGEVVKEPVVAKSATKEAVVVEEVIEPELDEEGNPVVSEELDPDLELDLNGEDVDPDAPKVGVIADDTPVTYVVDGEEVTKTFAQMKADAQKAVGAEKRFLEAAAIRKDAETKLAVIPEREKQLGQVLEYYIAQSTQFMEKAPDWEKLIAEDPQKYLAERHAWEKKQGELNQARQIQTELQRRNAEQAQASKSQVIAAEREKLLQALPEWQDPAKAAEGARAVGNYLKQVGIPDELLAEVDHHQVLVIARKAMLYDQAIAKQQAARKPGAQSVQKPQQTTRVERPGAASPIATQTQRGQAQRMNAAKAFKAAPSVETLANLFE